MSYYKLNNKTPSLKQISPNQKSYMDQEKLREETQSTIQNRQRLMTNYNLLYWYKQLYQEQFRDIPDILNKRILEVGSGTSPLKIFYNNVLTSDIMDLEYIDFVFNALEIDSFERIADNSLDIISLTNVLHHLQDPCDFLKRASKKLKNEGVIIFTEPYMSVLSKPLYLHVHYENTDLHITKPIIDKIEGPLSSANNALPFLIFNGPWVEPLRDFYDFSDKGIKYYTSISYMATGGIKRNFRIPGFIYRFFFHIDLFLSKVFPKLFASFFIQTLRKRSL